MRNPMGDEGADQIERDSGVCPFTEKPRLRCQDCCNRQQLSDAKNHSNIVGIPKVMENLNHGRHTENVEDATRHKPERQ